MNGKERLARLAEDIIDGVSALTLITQHGATADKAVVLGAVRTVTHRLDGLSVQLADLAEGKAVAS